jgi:hypothetical protein
MSADSLHEALNDFDALVHHACAVPSQLVNEHLIVQLWSFLSVLTGKVIEKHEEVAERFLKDVLACVEAKGDISIFSFDQQAGAIGLREEARGRQEYFEFEHERALVAGQLGLE